MPILSYLVHLVKDVLLPTTSKKEKENSLNLRCKGLEGRIKEEKIGCMAPYKHLSYAELSAEESVFPNLGDRYDQRKTKANNRPIPQ